MKMYYVKWEMMRTAGRGEGGEDKNDSRCVCPCNLIWYLWFMCDGDKHIFTGPINDTIHAGRLTSSSPYVYVCVCV